MNYDDFINSLDDANCPADINDSLRALWFEGNGDWDKAHRIVQNNHDTNSARIHAYLHRKEGDIWNAEYWHRQAGSVLQENMTLEQEWRMLVRQLTENE